MQVKVLEELTFLSALIGIQELKYAALFSELPASHRTPGSGSVQALSVQLRVLPGSLMSKQLILETVSFLTPFRCLHVTHHGALAFSREKDASWHHPHKPRVWALQTEPASLARELGLSPLELRGKLYICSEHAACRNVQLKLVRCQDALRSCLSFYWFCAVHGLIQQNINCKLSAAQCDAGIIPLFFHEGSSQGDTRPLINYREPLHIAVAVSHLPSCICLV